MRDHTAASLTCAWAESPLTLSAECECFTEKKNRGLQSRMCCVFVNFISITVPPPTASNGLWQNTADIDRETDADSPNCSLMTWGGSKSTYHPQSTTGGAVPWAFYQCVNTTVIYINTGRATVNPFDGFMDLLRRIFASLNGDLGGSNKRNYIFFCESTPLCLP